VKSHREFIAKQNLEDLTLLSDENRRVAKIFGADHWLLPVASRVYFIVDGNRRIVFKKKKALFPLKNQTETLLNAIDQHIH